MVSILLLFLNLPLLSIFEPFVFYHQFPSLFTLNFLCPFNSDHSSQLKSNKKCRFDSSWHWVSVLFFSLYSLLSTRLSHVLRFIRSFPFSAWPKRGKERGRRSLPSSSSLNYQCVPSIDSTIKSPFNLLLLLLYFNLLFRMPIFPSLVSFLPL